jgi:hypothetical protein
MENVSGPVDGDKFSSVFDTAWSGRTKLRLSWGFTLCPVRHVTSINCSRQIALGD